MYFVNKFFSPVLTGWISKLLLAPESAKVHRIKRQIVFKTELKIQNFQPKMRGLDIDFRTMVSWRRHLIIDRRLQIWVMVFCEKIHCIPKYINMSSYLYAIIIFIRYLT